MGKRPEGLVAALGLRLERLAICPLCLFGVACALEGGDERELRRALGFFTEMLWDEGLEDPLKTALSRARVAGVPGAEAATREVEALGPRSRFVKAVVQDLARQQLDEAERARAASLN
jgi:hypothetical protein